MDPKKELLKVKWKVSKCRSSKKLNERNAGLQTSLNVELLKIIGKRKTIREQMKKKLVRMYTGGSNMAAFDAIKKKLNSNSIYRGRGRGWWDDRMDTFCFLQCGYKIGNMY